MPKCQDCRTRRQHRVALRLRPRNVARDPYSWHSWHCCTFGIDNQSPTISPMRSISCAICRRASVRAPSSRTSGRSRCTTSAIDSSRCTPARLIPASSTRCLISRSRSSSSLRIDAHAADRARRPHQPEPLVLAQRLRVHAEQPRRHADKVQIGCSMRHASGAGSLPTRVGAMRRSELIRVCQGCRPRRAAREDRSHVEISGCRWIIGGVIDVRSLGRHVITTGRRHGRTCD